MDKFDTTINRIKQHTPHHELSVDFENCVFAKIKKKKRQRKITASAALGVALFGFLFVAQGILFRDQSQPAGMMANRESASTFKEEIPVMEDVVFASSDDRAQYAIDQVGYLEDDGTI